MIVNMKKFNLLTKKKINDFYKALFRKKWKEIFLNNKSLKVFNNKYNNSIKIK